jgi:hypothetical protein
MQVSHIISDLILAGVGIFVFFKFLNKLNLHDTILWESFVLSVVGSAIFGAIGFAGYSWGTLLSQFFQNLAMITGGVGLAAAAFGLIYNQDFSNTTCYAILTIGFLLFVVAEVFGIHQVKQWVPIVSMALVAIAAILGLMKGKYFAASWLLAAVAMFAMAQFRSQIFGTGESTIDVFHALVAGGIFSTGLATVKQ